MRVIGTYRVENREYVCLFHEDEQIAEAVGPFPLPPQAATRGTVITRNAQNIEQARILLEKAFCEGHWVE